MSSTTTPSARSVALDPAWIKALRQALGLSQHAMARQLTVSEMTVRRWESGATMPHPIHRRRLLELAAEAGPSPASAPAIRP